MHGEGESRIDRKQGKEVRYQHNFRETAAQVARDGCIKIRNRQQFLM